MLQFNTFLSLSCEEFVRIHHICEELFFNIKKRYQDSRVYFRHVKNWCVSANFLSRTGELNCAYVHFLGHMALLTVEKSMLLHVKSEYKKVRRSF